MERKDKMNQKELKNRTHYTICKLNEKTILTFKYETVFIDKKLKTITISENSTHILNLAKCRLESINMEFSKQELLDIAEFVENCYGEWNFGNKHVIAREDNLVIIWCNDNNITIYEATLLLIAEYLKESEKK